MAKVTNSVGTSTDDLLDFEEAQPVGRQNSARTASTFTPNASVLEKMAPMLARSGAVQVKGVHPTPAAANKAAAFLLAHARVLAEQMDPPRSAAVRLVDSTATVVKPSKSTPLPGIAPYTAIVELTHKRQSKPKGEEAAASEPSK